VLLRGINVGGRNLLPMGGLREALADAGCTDVVTYIQSGNAVITPPTSAPADLAAWMHDLVSAAAGFEVPVVLRTSSELERTLDQNPFPGASGTQLHVTFFPETPPVDLFDELSQSLLPEQCVLAGRELYLCVPDGLGRAKLPVAIERAVRSSGCTAGTTRNWNTVLKLVELAS